MLAHFLRRNWTHFCLNCLPYPAHFQRCCVRILSCRLSNEAVWCWECVTWWNTWLWLLSNGDRTTNDCRHGFIRGSAHRQISLQAADWLQEDEVMAGLPEGWQCMHWWQMGMQQVQGSVLPGVAAHILVQNRECGVQGYMIKVTGYDDKMKFSEMRLVPNRIRAISEVLD